MEVNEQTFAREVLEADRPVLVDFWASWCGPCQMMAPIVDQLAEDMVEKIKVGKVDVDQNSGLAEKYGVMSIPSLFLFRDGQIIKQWLGVQGFDSLKHEINQILSS